MATTPPHHVGETDPAKVIASSLIERGYTEAYSTQQEVADEIAAAIVADVRAAGFSFSRKMTKAECDEMKVL